MKSDKFKGVNKLCVNCIRECKQFANVKVIKCPRRKIGHFDSKKTNKIK